MLTRRALKYMRSHATILQPMHSRQSMTMYSFHIHALSYFHHVFLNHHSKPNPLDIQTKNELVKWLSSSQQKKNVESVVSQGPNAIPSCYFTYLTSSLLHPWEPAGEDLPCHWDPVSSHAYWHQRNTRKHAHVHTHTHTHSLSHYPLVPLSFTLLLSFLLSFHLFPLSFAFNLLSHEALRFLPSVFTWFGVASFSCPQQCAICTLNEQSLRRLQVQG